MGPPLVSQSQLSLSHSIASNSQSCTRLQSVAAFSVLQTAKSFADCMQNICSKFYFVLN